MQGRGIVSGIAGLCALVMMAAIPAPARADENARLSNILLVEQLLDVGTTQRVVHEVACTSDLDVTDARGRIVGNERMCLDADEGDPIARPFVKTPTTNVAAALVLNGAVRLLLRRHSPKALRIGLMVYPLAIARTLTTAYTMYEFAQRTQLSIGRRM